MSMTPTERILNTLAGKQVDRLPVMDIFHNVDLIEHLTGKTLTSRNAEDLCCEAIRSKLDLCRHFAVPDPEWFEDRQWEDEDGFVLRENWWTGAYVHCPVQSTEEARDQMKKDADRIRRATEDHRVLSQAQVHVNLPGERCETFEEIGEVFNRVARKLQPTVSVCPETEVGMYTALARYGFEWFFFTYQDYPQVVRDFYNALTDYEAEKIRTYGRELESPIAMLSEAVASNTGLLFRPDFIREFQMPNIRKIVDAWKAAGKKVIFHADGNRWDILDDIIAMGVDSINPCEELAGMTVREFKKRYPDITIGSVIDCQHLLAMGTIEEIQNASRKLVQDADNHRVFLGSSSEIHPRVPVENALAMYDILCHYHEMSSVKG
ncbi:MAG: hypothetical protein JXA11_02480 [Phycisphaerae bacterium]|nr:hypothetical protein [Phycisphaerae bacterium]